MKTCPTCNHAYDDAVRFCLADGATLVRSDQAASPSMTMPAQPASQASQPPPTLQMTLAAKPSMSVARTLTHGFFFAGPGR